MNHSQNQKKIRLTTNWTIQIFSPCSESMKNSNYFLFCGIILFRKSSDMFNYLKSPISIICFLALGNSLSFAQGQPNHGSKFEQLGPMLSSPNQYREQTVPPVRIIGIRMPIMSSSVNWMWRISASMDQK
jgi:hypothetical protein